MRGYLFGVLLAATGVPSHAQVADIGNQEIIVTGARRSSDSFDDKMPVVGLRRTADFAVQPIFISGDTRDADQRHEEIYQTLRRAIDQAGSAGVQLAFGDEVVEQLMASNYRDVTLRKDDRPDTNKIELLVKTRLVAGGDARAATARIDRFIKSIKPVGRALVSEMNDMTLSIVAPDQYRGAIADQIATDARTVAAKFGPNYAVEVKGLNRPVEWARAGLTDVLLYIPYELSIVPAPAR